LKSSEEVIAAFIFTPEQIEKNPFKSDHCLKFMIESLKDLENQLKKKGGKLFFFQGKPEEIVRKCIGELTIEALIVNRDYTPYSRQRDKKLENVCKMGRIPFYSFDDALLHPPESTLKKDGKPYVIFTPYFRNASKQKVLPPTPNQWTNYFHGSISFAKDESIFPRQTVKNRLFGGRSEALKILKGLSSFDQYGKLRDFPAEKSSTHLSPYLKFTVCSPREVYAAICRNLGPHHELIRSLYWRDFFTSIAFFFPHVFKGAFHPEFDKLKWSYNKKAYERWCEGSTGFPIVDAGMREMKETGFMHNRIRMITASFLIKDLHIDWRLGEKYFARTLIDYDPALNNGNWQWVASVGSDAQPYFRIFNPWNQQKKFDPHCTYIKKCEVGPFVRTKKCKF
jgi:deoxyribodipyrimidine photo-lyase